MLTKFFENLKTARGRTLPSAASLGLDNGFRRGIQRGDVGGGVLPRFVEFFLLFRIGDEFAVEFHDVAALRIGFGRFEERDEFLVALFQRGDVALDLVEMGLRLFARGGDSLAFLRFLAFLFLGLGG